MTAITKKEREEIILACLKRLIESGMRKEQFAFGQMMRLEINEDSLGLDIPGERIEKVFFEIWGELVKTTPKDKRKFKIYRGRS